MLLMVYLFFLHFLADFVFQSREMGEKKSDNINYLMLHVAIQWFTIFIGLMYFLTPIKAYQLATAIASVHGIVDAFIWRWYKYDVSNRINAKYTDEESAQFASLNWAYWKDKRFYSTIGFDQFLHYSTIVLAVWFIL